MIGNSGRRAAALLLLTLLWAWAAASVRAAEETAGDDPLLPRINKHPTAETVTEGGSAEFVAWYGNATWAAWQFISPQGDVVLAYDRLGDRFPGLEVVNGDRNSMTLRHIPLALDGWSVACQFTNSHGSVTTRSALITVTAANAPERNEPQPPAEEPAPGPETEENPETVPETAPSPVPEATPEPTPTPTPSPTPAPTTAPTPAADPASTPLPPELIRNNQAAILLSALLLVAMLCGTAVLLAAMRRR